MKKQILNNRVALCLATWFGSGKSPVVPGTVGSFCSLPLAYAVSFGGAVGVLLGALLVFFIGWRATGVALKTAPKHDPGYIVIDETVGQVLTFFCVAQMGVLSPLIMFWGFVLFRFFDIVKIWPASFFDRHVSNAFGVMMDDVVAGLYAALALYGLTFIF